MAEVYKCRLSGIGGFDKIVVVKRMLPEMLEDRDFVHMFLDEARIAAKLSHPNIVQIFEIDQIDDAPYIAMEYARGPTLSRVIHESWRQSKPCARIAAKVLSEIAGALAYAHAAVDDEGQSLGIVHRDVTPHNIVVTPEGAKLLDFGVAKASGRLSRTAGRSIKGKFRYMAPEQLKDDRSNVDGRADVFAVGVCLYLAATGRHAYSANDEISVLKAASEGAFPRPSEVYPEVDRELEEIILWAMDPSLERRCPDAMALQRTLDSYVSQGGDRGDRVTNHEVGQFVRQLFGDLNKSDQLIWGAYSEDHNSSKRFSAREIIDGPEELDLDDIVSGRQATPARERTHSRGRPTGSKRKSNGASRRLIVIGAVSVLLFGALVAVLWDRASLPSASEDPGERTEASPSPPQRVIDEKTPPAAPLAVTKADVPAVGEASRRPVRQEVPKPQGRITVVTDTPARVLIDGRFEGMSPLTLTLPAEAHSVKVRARGFPSQQKVIVVGADVDAQLMFRFGKRGAAKRDVAPDPTPPEPVATGAASEPLAAPLPSEYTGDGWLTLRTEPWCDVYLSGEHLGTTPINRLVFPTGKYSLRLVNESAKIDRTLEVEIRTGEESTTRLMLEPEPPEEPEVPAEEEPGALE